MQEEKNSILLRILKIFSVSLLLFITGPIASAQNTSATQKTGVTPATSSQSATTITENGETLTDSSLAEPTINTKTQLDSAQNSDAELANIEGLTNRIAALEDRIGTMQEKLTDVEESNQTNQVVDLLENFGLPIVAAFLAYWLALKGSRKERLEAQEEDVSLASDIPRICSDLSSKLESQDNEALADLLKTIRKTRESPLVNPPEDFEDEIINNFRERSLVKDLVQLQLSIPSASFPQTTIKLTRKLETQIANYAKGIEKLNRRTNEFSLLARAKASFEDYDPAEAEEILRQYGVEVCFPTPSAIKEGKPFEPIVLNNVSEFSNLSSDHYQTPKLCLEYSKSYQNKLDTLVEDIEKLVEKINRLRDALLLELKSVKEKADILRR